MGLIRLSKENESRHGRQADEDIGTRRRLRACEKSWKREVPAKWPSRPRGPNRPRQSTSGPCIPQL